MPTTKTGIEKPVKARAEAAGSASRPRRRAANIPRGTPIVTAQRCGWDDELERAGEPIGEVARHRAVVEE